MKQVINKQRQTEEDHHLLCNKRSPTSRKYSFQLIIVNLLHSTPAYVTLLLLSYALGYLSAPKAPSTTTSISPAVPSSGPTTASVLLQAQLDNFRVTTRCAEPIPLELVRETLIARLFNGSSPFTNFPPPHAVGLLEERAPKGWGSNGAVFRRLMEKVRPKVIIEVGTFLGASALHMARLAQELGLQTQVLCVDDFRGWPGFTDQFRYLGSVNGDVSLMYQFMWNAAKENATGSVLPVPYSSGSALWKLCEWGVYGDLIEIDAGHDFNSAWADINRAVRVLAPGGVMFGHDYFTGADNRGVKRAVDLFARFNGFKVRTDGQHWVIYTS